MTAWPEDNHPGWESEREKAVSIRRKRRASASHNTVDLEVVTFPLPDPVARACAVITCANATDAADATLMLDTLGILRQVRGEAEPDTTMRTISEMRSKRHEDGSVV